MTDVPVASSHRWQPLRIGIVDLFYYDYAEFWFRDGRVLFRGNNGTGKSKILALTLPFLLDGDLSPSRVEPDGDRDKRMEWNLLLGGKYDERLGYAWLELGRVAEDGERAYVTVGCGLRAAHGRGVADRWFFLTSQRIGQDLFLIGQNGTTLPHDRLVDAIGQHGQVTRTGEQYRRWIDEHLFHLGDERYDALISLLIQLRQPQLSKRPNEEKLSNALSEALPPIDQAVLSDIAAAFHDLEQQREELNGLRETRGHVEQFLERYRRYAAVAARRQGRELRAAHAAYEDVQRNLSSVRDLISAATAEERTAERELDQAEQQLGEQAAVRDELNSDPRLKNLADAQRYAEESAAAAVRAGDAASRAKSKRDKQEQRVANAERSTDQTRLSLVGAERDIISGATRAGIDRQHAALLAPLALPDGGERGLTEERIRSVEGAIKDLSNRRLEAVDHVIGLAEAAARRQADLIHARTVLAERERDRDAAQDRVSEAEDSLTRSIDEHVASWRAYAGKVTLLTVPDPDEVGLAEWAESLSGANPAVSVLRDRDQAVGQRLASERASAETRLVDEQQALRALEEERSRLESGEIARPPAPYTRGENVRDGRPGAPLWQVVDFHDDVDDTARAGIEAALESAGLLDAWITPDGRLLDSGTHDVVVSAGIGVAGNLRATLRPVIDPHDPRAATLTDQTVEAVLAGVGLGEQDCAAWIAVDGRWRVGPLRGEWAKPVAEYIGHGAREEARQRRLAELTRLIEETHRSVERIAVDVAAVERRMKALTAEFDRHPSDQQLRDTHADLAGARAHHAYARGKLEEQREEVDRVAAGTDQAVRERNDAAADLALPTELDALRGVRDAVGEYRGTAAALAAAMRRHADRLADLVTWRGELEAAETELAMAEDSARTAAANAAEEHRRLEALQEAIGATVEELEAKLNAARARIQELRRELEGLREYRQRAAETRARAEGQVQLLTATLDSAIDRRDTAVRDFQRFASTGLLGVACGTRIEIPDVASAWAPDPAVRLARRAEQVMVEIDDGDDAWKRVQDEIARRYSELSEALSRHGHHAVAGLEDWFIVAVEFQGRERSPDELAELLTAEIDYRERMLTAKERNLLEEHLVNDVASHLQKLISDAGAQVAQMNAELEERPTSTGMRLRLRWESKPDGPAGLLEARSRLLRQESDLWSPEDRAAVGAFLQREIEAERAADELGTWTEHLHRALDYRSWHRSVSRDTKTADGDRPRARPPAVNACSPCRCPSSRPRRRTTGRRIPTRPVSSHSTKRSPASTTTLAPSASGSLPRLTSTWP